MGDSLRLAKFFLRSRSDAEANAVSASKSKIEVVASRHDDHNLEIKSIFDASNCLAAGSVEIYLFVPGSMHIDPSDKQKVMSDFYSRVRLSIPSESSKDQDDLLVKIRSLKELIDATQSDPSSHATIYKETNETIFSAARHIGAVFGEIYKNKSFQLKKELLLLHSLLLKGGDMNQKLIALGEELKELCRAQSELREVLQVEGAKNHSILTLLDRYLHNSYAEFLAGLRIHFDQLRAQSKVGPDKGAAIFSKILDQYLNAEAEYAFRKFNYSEIHENEIERERHILQQHQLKKFFQSEMFVDVVKGESIKKFSEPVASLAAAAAAGITAAWALLFQRVTNPDLMGIGFQGMFIICLGIALYVLKDRLKDHGRAFFTRKISKYLPDVDQTLRADDKKIGSIKEWYSLRKKSDLVPELVQLRESAYHSSAEAHIHEDIIVYKRDFEIGAGAQAVACHDILRINMQRYLKHMDDPVKDMKFLDENGQVAILKSRRVYHFYLAIVARSGDPKILSQQKLSPQDLRQLHRVVMDKGGIVRMEQVV